MNEFLIYLIKTGGCLTVFWVTYRIFLYNTTLFRFNRYFLLAGITLSFIIPLIKLTYKVVIMYPYINNTISANNNTAGIIQYLSGTGSSSVSITTIILIIYFTGAAILILKTLFTQKFLLNLLNSGKKYKEIGYTVIEHPNAVSPFSVLNFILFNSGNLSDIEKELIIKHETIHIKQKHWIDLILSECFILLQWFNPIAWLYIRNIKENHEFLADRSVIDSGISPVTYQAVLLNQRFQGPVFSVFSPFKQLKTFKRLIMMTKPKSPPWRKAIIIALCPVFGAFVWASAEPHYVVKYSQDYIPTLSVADTIPDETPSPEYITITYPYNDTIIDIKYDVKKAELAEKSSRLLTIAKEAIITETDNDSPALVYMGAEPDSVTNKDRMVIVEESLSDFIKSQREIRTTQVKKDNEDEKKVIIVEDKELKVKFEPDTVTLSPGEKKVKIEFEPAKTTPPPPPPVKKDNGDEKKLIIVDDTPGSKPSPPVKKEFKIEVEPAKTTPPPPPPVKKDNINIKEDREFSVKVTPSIKEDREFSVEVTPSIYEFKMVRK